VLSLLKNNFLSFRPDSRVLDTDLDGDAHTAGLFDGSLTAGDEEIVRLLGGIAGTESLEASDRSVLSESLLHGPFANHSSLTTSRERNNLLASAWNHSELVASTVVGSVVVNEGNKVAGPGNITGTIRLVESVSNLGADDAIVIVDSAHESDIGGNGSVAIDMNRCQSVGTKEEFGWSVHVAKTKSHSVDNHVLHPKKHGKPRRTRNRSSNARARAVSASQSRNTLGSRSRVTTEALESTKTGATTVSTLTTISHYL